MLICIYISIDKVDIYLLQVVISRMTLLSTVALTLSNEKRHYSNATLCAMTITNYTRSSSHMGDFLVFHLKPSTTVDQINHLIEEVKR